MADISVTAGSVIAGDDARIANGTAGATITAGQTVAKNTTSGKWVLAEADAATTAAMIAGSGGVGIALNGASDGQPIQVQIEGDINPGGTVTIGEIYCVSPTAGGIAPFSDLLTDDYVTVLGVGTTASNIKMLPIVSGVQVQ